MQTYKRATRVAELIQQASATAIRNFEGLNIAVVTITQVKLADDLYNCKIYFSVFGDEAEKEKNKKIMFANKKELRHQLALKLNMRRTPEIELIYDDTSENATKVIELLEKLKNE
jgi:ribosome-binding factor A